VTLINDQVMPELSEDFGSAVQVPSGIVLPNIQATALVEDYRRVVSSARDVAVTLAGSVNVTFTFVAPTTESRRWIFARILASLAVDITTVGTLQRGASVNLQQEFLTGTSGATVSMYLIGRYAHVSPSLAINSNSQLPAEVLQPNDSEMRFKISRKGGGVLGAGSVTLETMWMREPPLRRWITGRAQSRVVI